MQQLRRVLITPVKSEYVDFLIKLAAPVGKFGNISVRNPDTGVEWIFYDWINYPTNPWRGVVPVLLVGDRCNIIYVLLNMGDGAGNLNITITDIDTGEVLHTRTEYVQLPPSYAFVVADIGVMPNRDWRLRISVTP